MSTENQEVVVEPSAEEKTETKEVKGTKRAAEVSRLSFVNHETRAARRQKYFLALPNSRRGCFAISRSSRVNSCP